MRLKLLLIPHDHRNPNDGRSMGPIPFIPLGIATLTGCLQQHHFDVDQDDLDIKVDHINDGGKEVIDKSRFSDQHRVDTLLKTGTEESLEQLGERMLKETNLRGYDVIGFSIFTGDSPSATSMPLVLGKLIKERHGATIIMGGEIHRPSEEKILSSGYVDYAILGKGETSIAEVNTLHFCREFERGGDLRSLPGVECYWGGKLHRNLRDYSREEKMAFTTPVFNGLPMELYRKERDVFIGGKTYAFRELVIPYFFVRGCPHSCAFCNRSTEKHWAVKEPEVIAAELKELSKRHHTSCFYFHNATMNPTYHFAEKLADELIRQDVNIKWSDCANIMPLDRALLMKLKEAGAVRLVFGLESASPPILGLIGKPFAIDQAAAILKAAHEVNILTVLDLICGFPYEREQDTEVTLNFLRKHQEHIMGCNINKFWMSGLFHQHPDRYAIRCDDREGSVIRYEEMYGLDWEERIELTGRTYRRIREVIDGLFGYPPGDPAMFFTYGRMDIGWDALKKEMLRQARESGLGKPIPQQQRGDKPH